MDVSGGTGMFKTSELERLYRDVRCGGFHPANSAIAREVVGKDRARRPRRIRPLVSGSPYGARKRFTVTRYRVRASFPSSRWSHAVGRLCKEFA
jgi:hypothetical protein